MPSLSIPLPPGLANVVRSFSGNDAPPRCSDPEQTPLYPQTSPACVLFAKGAQTPTKRVIEEGDLSLELHPARGTEQAPL